MKSLPVATLRLLTYERKQLLHRLAPYLKAVSSATKNRAKADRERRRQRKTIRALLKANGDALIAHVMYLMEGGDDAE